MSKSKKKELTNEGALVLLEAMLKGSADTLRTAIPKYLDALDKEIKLRATIKPLLDQLLEAEISRADAEVNIRAEFAFLTGKKTVKPLIDGKQVVIDLIREVLGGMDTDDIETCVQAAKKKLKPKAEEMPV